MSDTEKNEPAISDIFICARCGYCCHGETTVSLNEEDQKRMVRVLGQSREDVSSQFWRITGRTVQMKTVDGHCIFYADDVGCTVHEGRPWRCGQWPLHPSILSDRANFETIRESCPGINRELSYEEFCELFKQLLEADEKMMF